MNSWTWSYKLAKVLIIPTNESALIVKGTLKQTDFLVQVAPVFGDVSKRQTFTYVADFHYRSFKGIKHPEHILTYSAGQDLFLGIGHLLQANAAIEV
jgi:hypothetical protein